MLLSRLSECVFREITSLFLLKMKFLHLLKKTYSSNIAFVQSSQKIIHILCHKISRPNLFYFKCSKVTNFRDIVIFSNLIVKINYRKN